MRRTKPNSEPARRLSRLRIGSSILSRRLNWVILRHGTRRASSTATRAAHATRTTVIRADRGSARTARERGADA